MVPRIEIVKSLMEIARNITTSVTLQREFDNPDNNIGGKDIKKEIREVTQKISEFKILMRDELNIGDYHQ